MLFKACLDQVHQCKFSYHTLPPTLCSISNKHPSVSNLPASACLSALTFPHASLSLSADGDLLSQLRHQACLGTFLILTGRIYWGQHCLNLHPIHRSRGLLWAVSSRRAGDYCTHPSQHTEGSWATSHGLKGDDFCTTPSPSAFGTRRIPPHPTTCGSQITPNVGGGAFYVPES